MRKIFAALILMMGATAMASNFLDGQDAYDAGKYEIAAVLFKAAAEQGDVDAQYNLGVMYDQGQGVPQDYAEAVRWYRLAAQQGDVDAQYNLAVMYDEGDGVAQDSSKAVGWYRLAAEQGAIDAQYNLGVMYDEGDGVAQDQVRAHMWFDLAAKQGDEAAAETRDLLAKEMKKQQVEQAQKLASECLAKNYKNCD